MLTNDGRCTCEIKSRIDMTKTALNKKGVLFTIKMGLNGYILNIVLNGAETWTLRAVDQKHLEIVEMWCWRRMEKFI
jgi:hypothetical protein